MTTTKAVPTEDRAGRWQCSPCGFRTNGPIGHCKGYCYDRTGNSCDAIACPRCGALHSWTGSVVTTEVLAPAPTGEPQPVTQEVNKQPPPMASVFAPAVLDNEHQAIRCALAEIGFGAHVETLADVALDALKHRGFEWQRTPAPAPEWVGEYRRDLAQIARAV